MALKGLSAILHRALAGSAVPMLSVKSSKFTVVKDGDETAVSSHHKQGKVEITYVRVIFVNAANHVGKIYYKDGYVDGEEGKPPTCMSEDGVLPSAHIKDPQHDTCQMCKHNAFNTAMGGTGKGKACRDVFKTAVIVPEFSMTEPVMLRIPPASLKGFMSYVDSFKELTTEDHEGSIADFPCIVYFDPEQQNILAFEADEWQNEDEKVLHIEHESKTHNLIGTHAVQVHDGELIEHKKEPPKAIEYKKAEPKRGEPKKIEKEAFKRLAEEPVHTDEEGVEVMETAPKGAPSMRGLRTKTNKKPEGIPTEVAATNSNGLKNMLNKAMGR